MRRYLAIVCVSAAWAAAVPAAAHAAIRINEIAWMGTSKSATAEWIELANTGAKSVNIGKWTLTASDGSPHIIFPSSTHIAAHGYFLLERTRNGAVPGVTADLIYTGGLSNTGEILTLANSASTTVDTVISGKKWCLVGGSNTTKETAQRTATGWITATSTPRSVNATTGTVPACATTQSDSSAGSAGAAAATTSATATATSTTTATSHKGPSEYEPIPVVYMKIKAAPITVAGADMKFVAVVADSHGKAYPRASVHFAFGDGSASNSRQVFKNYRVPGTYLVTATAVEGLGSGEAETTVIVHRTSVQITSVSSVGISLRNNSPYQLDLSFWKLHAATTTFSFPEGTKMLPYTTVTFPSEITHLSYAPHTTALWYPGGKVAVRYEAHGAVVQAQLAPQHRVKVQPRTVVTGCNTIQGTCPATHVGTVSVNFTPHENTTVLAPATTADAEATGALVATALLAQNTATDSASITAPIIVTALPTSHKSFFTPWHISLAGVALASGMVLMAL